MAGFDEATMERLAALTTKAKAGVKLTAAEALEVKELKLQKSMVAIAQERAQIAVARRKIEDREKYRLGGLALASKLNGWSEDALKGGFALLAEMSEAEKAALAERGRQEANDDPAKPVLQMRVSFREASGEMDLTGSLVEVV